MSDKADRIITKAVEYATGRKSPYESDVEYLARRTRASVEISRVLDPEPNPHISYTPEQALLRALLEEIE